MARITDHKTCIDVHNIFPGSPVRPELPDSQKHWEEEKIENGLGGQSLGLHTIKSHVGTHQSLHKLSMQTHTHNS